MAGAVLSLWLAGWVFAAPVRGGADLVATAAASPRPAACRDDAGGAPPLWSRTRRHAQAAYCAALARGYARLAGEPESAREASAAAERAWSGQAAPSVLEARALLALERPADAVASFERARGRDPHATDAPEALHDYAVAALLTGRLDAARLAYRELVPRVELLDDPPRARRILVEAAGVAMARGPDGLDEAIGYLGEARRRAWSPGLGPLVSGLLALAWSRKGRADAARGAVTEAGGELVSGEVAAAMEGAASPVHRSLVPVLPPGEQHALAAVLAEPELPEDAAERWRAYLAAVGEGGVWSEHARRRLAALGGGR